MKSLKYKAIETSPGVFFVQITDQSHRGSDFGDGGSQFIHDGVYLTSSSFVQNNLSIVGTGEFFVRGLVKDKDDRDVFMTLAQIEKFDAAVKAYNLHFGSDAYAWAPTTVSRKETTMNKKEIIERMNGENAFVRLIPKKAGESKISETDIVVLLDTVVREAGLKPGETCKVTDFSCSDGGLKVSYQTGEFAKESVLPPSLLGALAKG